MSSPLQWYYFKLLHLPIWGVKKKKKKKGTPKPIFRGKRSLENTSLLDKLITSSPAATHQLPPPPPPSLLHPVQEERKNNTPT